MDLSSYFSHRNIRYAIFKTFDLGKEEYVFETYLEKYNFLIRAVSETILIQLVQKYIDSKILH